MFYGKLFCQYKIVLADRFDPVGKIQGLQAPAVKGMISDVAHRGGNADGFGILQNPEGVVADGGDPVVDHNAVYGLIVAGKITFLIRRKVRDHADTGNRQFSVVIQLPHHLTVFILSADDKGRLRLFAVDALPVLVLMAVGRDDLSGAFKNGSAVGAFQPILI